jgi:hypothetical protein
MRVVEGERIWVREKERWWATEQMRVPHVSPCWGPTHERTGEPSTSKEQVLRSKTRVRLLPYLRR